MSHPTSVFPEAVLTAPQSAPQAFEGPSIDFTPLPGGATATPIFRTSPLTPMVCDRRAITQLLGMLLDRAGISTAEGARRLGMNVESLRPYLRGRRTKPSLLWFLKFVEACGGRVYVEFPQK